jgi:hypothetical protein
VLRSRTVPTRLALPRLGAPTCGTLGAGPVHSGGSPEHWPGKVMASWARAEQAHAASSSKE